MSEITCNEARTRRTRDGGALKGDARLTAASGLQERRRCGFFLCVWFFILGQLSFFFPLLLSILILAHVASIEMSIGPLMSHSEPRRQPPLNSARRDSALFAADEPSRRASSKDGALAQRMVPSLLPMI